MITGIHGFSMIVSSEESIAFYKRLGFIESHRVERGYDTVVIMAGYGMKLELFIDPHHPQRAETPESLGFRCLTLKVDRCEDVAGQFACGPIMKDWFGLRYCCITDPDGLPILFHE